MDLSSFLLHELPPFISEELAPYLTLLAKNGYHLKKYLGSGVVGYAFLLEDDSVLKLTSAAEEVKAAELLRTQFQYSAIPIISDIFEVKLDNKKHMWVIHREELRDLDLNYISEELVQALKDLIADKLLKNSPQRAKEAATQHLNQYSDSDLDAFYYKVIDHIVWFQINLPFSLFEEQIENWGQRANGDYVLRDIGPSLESYSRSPVKWMSLPLKVITP